MVNKKWVGEKTNWISVSKERAYKPQSSDLENPQNLQVPNVFERVFF
jgi:hypothetical protein